MTYLDRINYLWNLRRNGALRGSEHELCAFLLDASNRLGWKNPMTQTNALICGLLGMSEKTLMLSRNGLKQDGLIDFKPGKKGSPTIYILNEWPTNRPANALSCEREYSSTNGGTNAVQSGGLLKIQEKEKDIRPPNPQPQTAGGGEGEFLGREEIWVRICAVVGRNPQKAKSYLEEQALYAVAEVSANDMRAVERYATLCRREPARYTKPKVLAHTLLEEFHAEVGKARLALGPEKKSCVPVAIASEEVPAAESPESTAARQKAFAEAKAAIRRGGIIVG